MSLLLLFASWSKEKGKLAHERDRSWNQLRSSLHVCRRQKLELRCWSSRRMQKPWQKQWRQLHSANSRSRQNGLPQLPKHPYCDNRQVGHSSVPMANKLSGASISNCLQTRDSVRANVMVVQCNILLQVAKGPRRPQRCLLDAAIFVEIETAGGFAIPGIDEQTVFWCPADAKRVVNAGSQVCVLVWLTLAPYWLRPHSDVGRIISILYFDFYKRVSRMLPADSFVTVSAMWFGKKGLLPVASIGGTRSRANNRS